HPQSYADSGGKRLRLSGLALALAALYSLCFTGEDIFASLSSTVFIFSAMGVAVLALKILNVERCKEGYLWFFPIGALGLLNAILPLSAFNYLNIIAAYCMLTYAMHRVSGYKDRPFSLNYIYLLLSSLFSMFSHLVPFVKSFSGDIDKKRMKSVGQALLAALISIPFLIVICSLLASADPIFSYYIEEILDNVGDIPAHIAVTILFFVLFMGFLGHFTSKKTQEGKKPLVFSIGSVMPGTFLVLLNLLFAMFCLIQVAFLFTGGYWKLPDGIIYANYAREGFFQLVFVSVINFGVLILCLTVINGGQTGKAMTLLLILLSFFTGILIASSFYRISLYISAYRFTPLRLLVVTFLAMETVLVGITLCYLLMVLKHKGFDFIHAGGKVVVLFYIIANITGAGTISDRLNIQAYKSSGDIGIFSGIGSNSMPFDTTSLSYESADAIIKLLNDPANANNEELKRLLNNRLDNFTMKYSPENWQSWSLTTHLAGNALRDRDR
ncbi:MAG: DUF4173 domain-containing protein, partial [Clostridiales bacterium]|nr:DUF4173 domain-containing protein [Clostridiales bacterium]